MSQLYTISGPSGVGKSRLVRDLTRKNPRLHMSVSYTTRPLRKGEIDGSSYHFIDEVKFRDMLAADRFLEHAKVFDHFYGTPRREIEEALRGGGDIVLEIDWQGAAQIAQTDIDSCGVFVLPPSVATLRERLHLRASDHPEVIARRLAKALDEARHCAKADFIIINDDYPKAHKELDAVVSGNDPALRELLRRERQNDMYWKLLEDLEREVARGGNNLT